MLSKSLIPLSLVYLLISTTFCLGQNAVPASTDVPVNAQYLLKPGVFPNAQFGMSVKSVEDGSMARVVTTGAEFLINKELDTIKCTQRISRHRNVSTISLPKGTLSNIRLSSRTSGAAIFSGGSTTLRINGDSLLMLKPGKSGDIKADLGFFPDIHFEYLGNHNFFDPYGGISFFENGNQPNSKMKADLDTRNVSVTWPWKRGQIFWISVSPPKPFDWDASIKKRIVETGSSTMLFPPDSEIKRLSQYGNILRIHSEPMWKGWQTELVPKDMSEWNRVIKTAHEYGMKVIPYSGPGWFLKGTPYESKAKPLYDASIGVIAWGQPHNELIFLDQIRRVVKEFHSGGLYFDGIYQMPEHLAAAYHLVRSARELLGEEGILIYHGSGDTPSNGMAKTFCPPLNAHCDFVFKGEGDETNTDPGYIRYFLGTYNTSNSIALYCNAGGGGYTPPDSRMKLMRNANIRIPLGSAYMPVDFMSKNYWPYLTPDLKDKIMPYLTSHTGIFQAKLKREKELSERIARDIELGADLKAENFAVSGTNYKGGYWRFEEIGGRTAFNSVSDKAAHATLDGAVFRSDRVFGAKIPVLGLSNKQSMEFDGSEKSFVVLDQGPDLDVGTDDFTLEAWICPRSAKNRPVIAGKSISGITKPADTGYALSLRSHFDTTSGEEQFSVEFTVANIDGKTLFTIVGSGLLSFNEWHHVAGVRKGREIQLFVDGVKVNSIGLAGEANFTSDQRFGIGCARGGGGGGFYGSFDGYIDEVRLTIGKGLSPSEFLNAMKGDFSNNE